jgi:peptidoglycan-N-acetylmuramic acid deacetylase
MKHFSINLFAAFVAAGAIASTGVQCLESMGLIQKQITYKVHTQVSLDGLSTKSNSWYFTPNNNHTTPAVPAIANDFSKYSSFYVGDTSRKVIYLTFDEGYENGYSSKLLDTLKEKNVKAAFFVTKSFIRDNQELVKRMTSEGHIVGNHSVSHLNSSTLSQQQFEYELNETARYYKEVTGQEMVKVFRPPMGEYSIKSLAMAHNMGYSSIFWSFAYRDWLVDAQPGADVAYNTVMSRYHNGAILLLHAVSSSNSAALGRIIDGLRAQGYSFGTLDELV